MLNFSTEFSMTQFTQNSILQLSFFLITKSPPCNPTHHGGLFSSTKSTLQYSYTILILILLSFQWYFFTKFNNNSCTINLNITKPPWCIPICSGLFQTRVPQWAPWQTHQEIWNQHGKEDDRQHKTLSYIMQQRPPPCVHSLNSRMDARWQNQQKKQNKSQSRWCVGPTIDVALLQWSSLPLLTCSSNNSKKVFFFF
jgi:hypothetical protein